MFHAEQYYKTQNFSFIFSVVQKLDMVYDFMYLLGRIAMIFLSAVDWDLHQLIWHLSSSVKVEVQPLYHKVATYQKVHKLTWNDVFYNKF